jgi:hypothetical protein
MSAAGLYLLYLSCNFCGGTQVRVREWSHRATRCACFGGALGDR